MKHNQARFSDSHFLHGTVATASTTTTSTSQPPLSPSAVTSTTIHNHHNWGKLHCHIFHFQFQQLIQEIGKFQWETSINPPVDQPWKLIPRAEETSSRATRWLSTSPPCDFTWLRLHQDLEVSSWKNMGNSSKKSSIHGRLPEWIYHQYSSVSSINIGKSSNRPWIIIDWSISFQARRLLVRLLKRPFCATPWPFPPLAAGLSDITASGSVATSLLIGRVH